MVPANSSGFQKAKKIAIIEFSGDRSEEFAKNNRMQRAWNFFDQASKSFQNSPAILHNLGVCAEMNNKFDLTLNLITLFSFFTEYIYE